MNFSKVAAAVTAVVLGAASVVSIAADPVAKDQGRGTVTFTGAVIDSPCSISSNSVDQVVELGLISNGVLQANDGKGTSKPKNFEIQLEGCSVATAKTVTTTFTGAAGKDKRLGVTGNAKGVSIVIADGAGAPIDLGKPTVGHGLQEGNNTLLFSAYMQGDGVAADIVPGDFKGVVDFSLAYQ
ncbi:fimbria A protein [Pseudomonas protegens]|uniref:fimbrial protein n=1 Tax=Pseudomonas protegens TaxID=380021 RepID=UPI000F4B93F7|nr:fimbrial protein [Pseudomonas protegens]ROL62660.1 fimbria A protein [Pseudomonas protegens]